MKEIKTFILVLVIVAILKIVGGLLCNSYTMLASGILDILLVLVSLSVYKIKENKKYKGIISSLLGLIIVICGIGLIFFSTLVSIKKTSFFILLFLILTLFIKYVVGCFYTSMNYQKKKGILSYGNINSNLDFVVYGIILVTFVVGKFSKWVGILKYADMVGLVLISILIILKGLKIIVNSFKYLEDKEKEISEEYKKEITKRKEVKDLVNLNLSAFGGIKYAKCDIRLKDNVSMIDANTFVVTLQDYLLKEADIALINLVDELPKKKTRVRSKKQDARDSRSRNSKTNAKKKNSTKKNSKR